MGNYSPQILAWPEKSNTGSGVFIEAQTSYTAGEGTYLSIPRMRNVDDSTYYQAIPCGGYDQLHIMPVGDASSTPSFAVFGVWGNKQSGAQSEIYTVHTLCTMATADVGAGVVSMNGKVLTYESKNPTFTAAYSAVLDSITSNTSLARAGGSGVIGLVSLAYLGGCDYILVTSASGSTGSNVWLRFN